MSLTQTVSHPSTLNLKISTGNAPPSLLSIYKKERQDRNDDNKKYQEALNECNSLIDEQQNLIHQQQDQLNQLTNVVIEDIDSPIPVTQHMSSQRESFEKSKENFNIFLNQMKANGLKLI